jgi:hypothetical protein
LGTSLVMDPSTTTGPGDPRTAAAGPGGRRVHGATPGYTRTVLAYGRRRRSRVGRVVRAGGRIDVTEKGS